ncbi:hypothetical protein NQ315_006452 [Exocentrus adspersus]|uniref:Protein kinase domain-containing protein n=1 Tax=Exocentrus adspersus TaxID=1586481 RepID=A0AAV8W092_9CUCU|nr:hypothetical protein NQ315_006452 [Exocentrus adspersus]
MYKLSMCSPRVRGKLQKYFHLPKSYAAVDLNLALPLNQPCKLREEINAQYTPLEFVLQVHKYDKFEFPRNKILTSSVIGQGAFGKVLCGKAYEIASKPGFTNVAVKQLRDGATEEEVLDFQAEIDMLKRIGTHENVVRLLGCVTMDQPYLMVMELVTGGSLKDYLLNLRRKWTERQTPRIFFPDDMDEEWIKSNHEKPNGKFIFEAVFVSSTSDSSYIVPTTPISADSSVFLKTELGPKQKNAEAPKNPHTPTSMVSSRLPSSTETEFTNLDLESPTPLVAEVSRPPEPVLDHTELQRFAFQIASGMLCLEKMCVTHRDLAARNILITSDKVLKISDFGMSRSGAYVNRTSKKVPLRWMAIESIEDQKWDGKSDVWSFGVVLWEIGTLGAFPYEHTRDVLLLPELKSGKRLERPKNQGERPSFKELVELLDVKKRKVYVDFSQISPKYVFPPTRDLEKRVYPRILYAEVEY